MGFQQRYVLFVNPFVTFVGNSFLSQMVSFGICHGVVFSHDKIYWASLRILVLLASQIPNAELRLCLCSALGFFNLAWHGEKPGKMALVIFQGPDNSIFEAS